MKRPAVPLLSSAVIKFWNTGSGTPANRPAVLSGYLLDSVKKLNHIRGAVRGFRVKRDRPNLFSVIRNQKKNKIREPWMIWLSWYVKKRNNFPISVITNTKTTLFPWTATYVDPTKGYEVGFLHLAWQQTKGFRMTRCVVYDIRSKNKLTRPLTPTIRNLYFISTT